MLVYDSHPLSASTELEQNIARAVERATPLCRLRYANLRPYAVNDPSRQTRDYPEARLVDIAQHHLTCRNLARDRSSSE
jgi:hypothetical protein